MPQWEYKVIFITVYDAKQANLQSVINREAAQGWRLIAVTPTAGDNIFLYFERSR